MRSRWSAVIFLTAVAWGGVREQSLDGLFAPGQAVCSHCDLAAASARAARVTLWRGYETTGFATTSLPVSDFSPFASLRFEVENPSSEPLSVFVRLSNQTGHPGPETYTGGTFDGFVIGPGRSTVEISLEKMQSPQQHPVDARRIAWLGVFFQPLFLRDGLELMFKQDRTLLISNPRLSTDPAKPQKQPYGDLLFRETEPGLRPLRAETEQALAELDTQIGQAKARGQETAYAEIYPYLAQVAFRSRLAAFWQDRAAEQRQALSLLLAGAREAKRELEAVAQGRAAARVVPPLPDYGKLEIRDGYYRSGADPALIFSMLYNNHSALQRWFASNETDYGAALVAGGDRFNVEKQPIWQAYQKYPDTHRVGWDNASALIRDEGSWEVIGPPVIICVESPHTRDAIARMIEQFEKEHAGDRSHLVQNMDFEYAYVCYCERTRQMWARWLERKYTDVRKANAIWASTFEGFSSVPMPRPEQAAKNRALWFDWATFNLNRFVDHIRWTGEQVRRWEPRKALTTGSPYYAFDPAFWTGIDAEELTDSGMTGVVLEENYALDTLMPEYLHALAGRQPVEDFEYHGVLHQILPSFLHGDAAISMWWWNSAMHWTPNEPINEWTTSFPQSYTIPLSDLAKAMRDALDVRRLGREIAALGSAPRPIALLYSKSSMLQQPPKESAEIGTFPYLSSLRGIYNASQAAGLYIGLTTEKKILAGDLAQRKILVLPGAEFVPGPVRDAILDWVDGGGTLIVSPDSLLADEYARPSDTLVKLGLKMVRREPAPLKHGETVVTEYNADELPRMAFTTNGVRLEAVGARQVIECAKTEVSGRFQDGVPAVVRQQRGRGRIYWLAAALEPASWRQFLSMVARQAGLEPELQVTAEAGSTAEYVEHRVTELQGRHLAYLYNNSDREAHLVLKTALAHRGMLDLRSLAPVEGGRLLVPARETAIVEFQ
ncbi:MAG: beta-galactosidase [Bryobacteraceae bacterium]